MDDETRAAVKDALVREVIALGALLGVLWIMGPGRVLVPAWIARARARFGGSDVHEGQVRAFAREVSRWDHEQASAANRKAAGGGPCGCGGLRSPGRHRPDPARDAARAGPVCERDDGRGAGGVRAGRARHPDDGGGRSWRGGQGRSRVACY